MLTIEKQATILNRHINGKPSSAIAQEFGVTKTVINRILDSVDCKDLDDITSDQPDQNSNTPSTPSVVNDGLKRSRVF